LSWRRKIIAEKRRGYEDINLRGTEMGTLEDLRKRRRRSPAMDLDGLVELIGVMDHMSITGVMDTMDQGNITECNAISLGGRMARGVMARKGIKGSVVPTCAAVVLPAGRLVDREPRDCIAVV
jgi:hypothetical protein